MNNPHENTHRSEKGGGVFAHGACRNIALDIRYTLFAIDKYAGAGYLLKEMKIE